MVLRQSQSSKEMALKMAGRLQITTAVLVWKVVLVLVFCTASLGQSSQQSENTDKRSREKFQVTVPNRPANSLHSGEQGEQRSEIKFAPSTRIVTAKVHVEDPNGYFLPNLRPENFAVYED